MGLLRDEIQGLSVLEKDKFRVFVCRELLRAVEVIGDDFRPDHSNWLFFERFHLLRLIHVAVVSIKNPKVDLLPQFQAAFAAVSKHRASGSTNLSVAVQDALNLMPPVEKMPTIRTAEMVVACLLSPFSSGKEYLTPTWEAAIRQDLSNTNNLQLGDPIFGTVNDFRFSKTLRAFKMENSFRGYWFEWYRSFIAGDPLNWDLQIRVALIEDDIWVSGPKSVAERIKEIREAFESVGSDETRQIAYEPKSVSSLFDNRVVVAASATSLSAVVTQQFDAFISETGLNQTPEVFKPLDGMSSVLDRIADILDTQPRNETTEQALKEEVGRLNARVAALETELAKAKDDLENFNKTSWKKAAGWTVASSGFFGVLLSAVWTVSGDELGPQKRLDRLMEYRGFIFGGDDGNAPRVHQILPSLKPSDGEDVLFEV